MLRVAIVEDELVEQEQMKKLLECYQTEKKLKINIAVYEDGADFLEQYQNQYDIIFCDIKMKFTDGITTAKEIRKRGSEAVIIFITNLADFAIIGYEVEALGYILKPVSGPLFERYMDRAVRILNQKQTKYLIIESAAGILRIPEDEILYIECVKHYQYIYTLKETYRVLTPLARLEEKLNPAEFKRCSSGCLVHLNYVQKTEKNIATVNGKELPISRGKMKEFMSALTLCLTQNM